MYCNRNWTGSVEIDELADPVERAVGDARDHHPAVAVAGEDRVAEVLVVEHVDDVGDVRVEVDVGAQQVGPLTQAGQRRAVNLVALPPQDPGDLLVAPAAVAAPVDEDIRGHQREVKPMSTV